MNARIVSILHRAALIALVSFAAVTTHAAEPSWKVAGEPTMVETPIAFDRADAHLKATLYAPAQGDHLPAIVVLHAAEAATREYALYRHLARDLPALGFAVLVYDRRGSGESTGTLDNTDYEALADDGVAALHALAKNPRIDAHRIGFWGLSQGGWLSVLAASRTHDAAFAISVSAPMVTASQQMRFAVSNLLALRGHDANAIAASMDARSKWEAYLRGQGSRDDAKSALAAAERAPWFDDSFLPKSSDLPATPAESSWRKEMDLDPQTAVRAARVPLLFVYGGADPWVPVEASVRALHDLAKGRNDISVHVIAGADHTMTHTAHETMSFDKAAVLEEHPDVPAYFYLLAEWLQPFARR